MYIIIMEAVVFYGILALEFMWNRDEYDIFGVLFK